MTVSAAAVNFSLASFGACIEAVAKGYRSYNAVLVSILTGKPENIPAAQLFNQISTAQNGDLAGSKEGLLGQVELVSAINATQNSPVALREFCGRPENKRLKELCN